MERIREESLCSKSEIRKAILNIRDSMSSKERVRCQEEIRERVLSHISYLEAQVILAYAGFRSEVDTSGLIEQALADGRYVFVPRVAGEDMEFWQITSMEDLKSGYMGIPEPVRSIAFPEWMAVRRGNEDQKGGKDRDRVPVKIMMWMPGAVFDRERHRIGYGGGFYDRYLSRLPDRLGGFSVQAGEFQLTAAALAFECQVVRQIPSEPHDIRPDMVVTETGII